MANSAAQPNPYPQNAAVHYAGANTNAKSRRSAVAANRNYAPLPKHTQIRETQAQYNSVKNTRALRQERSPQQKVVAHQNTVMDAISNQHQTKQSKQGLRTVIKTLRRKMRAATVALGTIFPGLYVHTVLIFFWLISIFGLALLFMGEEAVKWIPWWGDDLAKLTMQPGQILFGVGWIGTTVIGLLTMLTILVLLLVRGVWWFKDSVILLLLILSVALYIAPVTSFFPWFLLFVAGVVWRYS